MSERQEIIDAATRAVKDASRVCRAVRSAREQVAALAKVDDSPVTIADFASQAVVLHRLRERLGPVRVLAEEDVDMLHRLDGGRLIPAVLEAVQIAWPEATTETMLDAIGHSTHGSPDESPMWALDPIDGTKGFVRGGQFAVCLARIEGGQPTLGVLGCPHLPGDLSRALDQPDPIGTLLVADIEGATWQPLDEADAAPRRIGTDHPLPEIITIARSYESSHSKTEEIDRVLAELGRPTEQLAVDSQVKYALVARGRAQVYLRLPFERTRRDPVWDHAAGAVIASAAGMVVTDALGAPLRWWTGALLADNFGIACAHPALHPALTAIVREIVATTPAA